MKTARYVETMLCWCKEVDCRFVQHSDDHDCPSKPEDTRIGRKPARLWVSNSFMEDDVPPHVERIIDEMLQAKNEKGEDIQVPHPRYGEKTFFTHEQLAEMDAQKAQREEAAAAVA